MDKTEIIHEIYHKAGTDKFITLYELETITGLTGSQLRPILEDLKTEILILEDYEGFQISDKGKHYCQTKWA